MFAVMVESDTAANSVLPIFPTEKTEATLREYCNKKVITKGMENLIRINSSVKMLVCTSGRVPVALRCFNVD
ncbi:hypothetical protein WICPIJ_002000 [Wickerhamomyces pijperi]|uniref:Uncharacterized protein n=1 Tax=Wickerhamomyces pijperi TaxID=599730 RepID=A0A9P8QAI5_WICPI|nr:hypothetical protein WICPIJ_002000 [Wickerhamomyces pijperi]